MPKKKKVNKFEILNANKENDQISMEVLCLEGKDSGKKILYEEIQFLDSIDNEEVSVSFEYQVISAKNRKLKKEKYESLACVVIEAILQNSFQDLTSKMNFKSKMEANVGTTDS